MNRILLTTSVLFLGIRAAQAVWTVYDPAVHHQQIISTAQEVAKFVEVIQKQVDQLRSLQEQVATLHHYVDLFGDPASFVPTSVSVLAGDLVKPEVSTLLGDLVKTAEPIAAMLEDGGGLFQAVGAEFTTPDGKKIARAEELYRAIAGVQQTIRNYLKVSVDASARRIALKAEIARTTAALAAAKTDAEVQKLGAVLVGLGAALQGTEIEVGQATASALVQEVATRADAVRQTVARQEEQAAQFTEALENYGKTFRLMSVPVAFPTK